MVLFLQHVDIEGPGLIESFLVKKNLSSKIIKLWKSDPLPRSFSGIEAVICLGGPMNVYQEKEHPFLAEEDLFIKDVLRLEIPFLGICLGSQLLAKAAGAKVSRASKQEIGFYDVQITPQGRADPVFCGFDYELKVFQWHEDTFDIPRDAYLLAQAKECPHQAFRIGSNAYGMQFHMEVDKIMIDAWIKEYWKNPNKMQVQKAQDILTEYDKIRNYFDLQSQTFFMNFLSLVLQ